MRISVFCFALCKSFFTYLKTTWDFQRRAFFWDCRKTWLITPHLLHACFTVCTRFKSLLSISDSSIIYTVREAIRRPCKHVFQILNDSFTYKCLNIGNCISFFLLFFFFFSNVFWKFELWNKIQELFFNVFFFVFIINTWYIINCNCLVSALRRPLVSIQKKNKLKLSKMWDWMIILFKC